MLLILSAVLVKVGLLQTFEGDALRSAAAQQWTRDSPLRAQRGSIFDRNGEELALSVPASTVAVNPKQVADPVGTAATFAAVLGLADERRDELAAAMAAKDRGFVYVARQVDDELAEQLAALELAGVTIYREDRRMLPGGDTGRSVDRPHRHRRHRHGRPREAVRQRARRHAGRADARGRPGRPLDRRQRAGRAAARARRRHRADDRPLGAVRHRAGAARSASASSAPAAARPS